MFIREYLRLMLRRPILSSLVGLLVFAAVLALGVTARPAYVSTTSLLFSFNAGSSATDLNQAATYLSREMTSYVRVATSPRVLQPVIDELGLQESPAQLAGSVAVENPTQTVILDIAVTREDPQQAADIANAVSRSLARTVSDMAPEVAQADNQQQTTLTVTPLNVAQPAPESQGVPIWLTALIGLVLGFLAAFVTALLSAGIDPRVRTVGDLRRMRGARVLAALPAAKEGDTAKNARLATRLERTAGLLVGASRGGTGSLVLVTTPDADKTLSQVTRALAAAVAQVGGRAVILDTANVPALQVAGLAQGTSAPGDALSAHVIDESGAIQEISRLADIRAFTAEFDVVLVQVPAFTTSADAQLFAEAADLAVVVVTMGARKERVIAAQAGLRALEDDKVVLVANRVPSYDL